MAELGRAALLVTLGLSVYALVAGGLAAWPVSYTHLTLPTN